MLRGATAPGHMIHILVARSESKVNFRSLASLDDRKICQQEIFRVPGNFVFAK